MISCRSLIDSTGIMSEYPLEFSFSRKAEFGRQFP